MSDKKTRPETAEEDSEAERREDSPRMDDAAQEAGADASGEAEHGGADPSGWTAGELDALRAENEELKDRVLRAAAEMENIRRRTERDKADTAKYAISDFARDVLSIGDNLRRAIEHVPSEAAQKDPALGNFLEGVEMTERELLKVMERHGIIRIDPKGERFDPNQHQAMYEVENKDVAEGTVVEVLQPGYLIADRILRPALVGVSKGGAKAPKPRPEEAAAAGESADQTGGEPPSASPQAANDDTPGQVASGEAGKEPRKDRRKAGKSDGPKGNVGGRVDRSA